MLTPARRGQLVADTNSAAIEDTNLATIHAKRVIAYVPLRLVWPLAYPSLP
ncbi:hypothetical protein FS749_003627 [Ceratobasidium sp. UAMH 11750]|nr:hypothetical protein FS749_003627 [Ceratobasidium sp. UAMH 11750]